MIMNGCREIINPMWDPQAYRLRGTGAPQLHTYLFMLDLRTVLYVPGTWPHWLLYLWIRNKCHSTSFFLLFPLRCLTPTESSGDPPFLFSSQNWHWFFGELAKCWGPP